MKIYYLKNENNIIAKFEIESEIAFSGKAMSA
jgi:hypothetical protein